MASRIRRPAYVNQNEIFQFDWRCERHTGITSRPIPSPGIRPMRNDFEAIGQLVLENSLY